jgi:hypothetical protein
MVIKMKIDDVVELQIKLITRPNSVAEKAWSFAFNAPLSYVTTTYAKTRVVHLKLSPTCPVGVVVKVSGRQPARRFLRTTLWLSWLRNGRTFTLWLGRIGSIAKMLLGKARRFGDWRLLGTI